MRNQRRPKRSEFAPQTIKAMALQTVYREVNQTPAVGASSRAATWEAMTAIEGTMKKETP